MFRDSVNQSDTNLIMTLENLIALAMGPPKENRINFKMFQTVLFLLANQMRLLKKVVYITTEELGIELTKSMEFNEIDSDYEEQMKHYGLKRDTYEKSSESSKKSRKGFDDDEDESRGLEKSGKKSSGKTGKMDRKGRQGGRDSSDSIESDEYDEVTGKTKKGRGGSDKDGKKHGKRKGGGSEDDDNGDEYDEVTGKLMKGGKRSRRGGKGAYDSDDEDNGKGQRRRGKGTAYDDSDGDDEFDSAGRGPGGRKQRRKGRGYADLDSYNSDDDGPAHKIHRVGSIEVVTQPEFDQLREAVRQMKRIKGPIPMPTMPKSADLRKGILSGSSSVPETMNAMQINFRVAASEKMIKHVADLLTRLAASGILPPDIKDMVHEAKEEADAVTTAAETYSNQGRIRHVEDRITNENEGACNSFATVAKELQYENAMEGDMVTQGRIADELDTVKTGLQTKMKELLQMIKTTNEQIDKDSYAIDKKLDAAMDVYETVKELRHSMTEKMGVLTDYEKSLYDQVHSCKSDMDVLKIDVKKALVELNRSVANPEALAMKSLTNIYKDLVVELEHVLFNHSTEMRNQEELSDNLIALKKIVADLEEQKSERDEVTKLLNNKACHHHLDGFIVDKDLQIARDTLNRRLSTSHNKFIQIDILWQASAKDLRDSMKDKATLVQLWNEKQEALKLLWHNEEKLRCLAYAIGDPAMALLTNHLSENAFCGACMMPAKMQPVEESHGKPPRLPKLLKKKGMLEIEDYVDPCKQYQLPYIKDQRSHLCHRWVGGSHTLLDNASRLQKLKPLDVDAPILHYIDESEHKQMFQLGAELNQVCRQCNVIYDASEEQDTQPSHPGEDHCVN